MKKTISFPVVTLFLLISLLSAGVTFSRNANDPAAGWRAGVARTLITPQEPMWMAGYAFRDHPAEGTVNDLWAKALILEDMKGNRALLITTDIESFPKYTSDRIRNRIKETYGLEKAQIILNGSHTHSGPVIQGMYDVIYTNDPGELKKVRDYSLKFEDKIVALVGEAIKSMKPAQIYSQNGVTRFQVNRRNNSEKDFLKQTEIKGPNDYAVPVLKITDASGTMMAVAFGYACHNTTLSAYEWCGDYAGFAQEELEKMHPGLTAMFFQGAGADQNPIPRGTVALARQYGKTLAAATERVLSEEMHELKPIIKTRYSEIKLEFEKPMTKDELKKIISESEGYIKSWAEDYLQRNEKDQPIMTSYKYPLQIWKLGDQAIIGMGGEVVVDYAIKLKQTFGQDIFVMGYCNDVMAYIPTAETLKEGGYEGAISQMAFGLPAVWKANIETEIIDEIHRLARKTGMKKVN
ncbi:MAG TPA: neutral/alkaline non-lysosomal ceramidase N-terminal domain-containing protein [Bacteroidales bacterium]|nr:neutral/alkaline non-lysosomal ceramidase N-terminal domain-containing protein [Bacteroidales bacterium]HPT20355.1 neutral/alkaline non-lysosomal ceramidase N-terminal domain-containing protein [Bacteroidales bacterium]